MSTLRASRRCRSGSPGSRHRRTGCSAGGGGADARGPRRTHRAGRRARCGQRRHARGARAGRRRRLLAGRRAPDDPGVEPEDPDGARRAIVSVRPIASRRASGRPLPDADGFVSELLLEGGGDPAMNSEDWWRLAADLRREGLRGGKGDLRIDDTLFEEPGWHPSWGRVSARAYHAPIGALTANYGSYFVSVWPQRPGSAPRVDIDPPVDYLRLRNTAVTQPRSERPRLVVDRLPGRASDGPVEEVVRVEGATRVGDRVDRFPRSVLDPGLYAGSLLALQLEANGIFVDGEVRRGPRGAEEPLSLLLDRGGRSVAEAVALCMKYSNNSIAESLVKNLAIGPAEGPAGSTPRRGDWAGGIRALREALGELGVDLSGATLVDGSGLSIQNRLSPRMLVEALRAGRASFRIGPEFVASLPIAELDGTLDKRLRGAGGRIRAKTGLLSDAGVTALSGFVDRPDGETLVFSIVVNGFREGASGAMQAVDRLALLLDRRGPRGGAARRRGAGAPGSGWVRIGSGNGGGGDCGERAASVLIIRRADQRDQELRETGSSFRS
ncbi:MAG: D-alanyl-D-alanine carboxypeptidase/D-alanyl-D-alanine-endopeptidase [Myxococcota bacterium]